MLKFPARFEPQPEGGYAVTFRDVPEAITQGETLEEAQDEAADALLTALDFYFEDRRPVPEPSKARKGERLVAVPASAAAKVKLLNAVLATKVRPVDLARALGVKPQEVTRLLDLQHATKIDAIAAALQALGYELELDARPVAA
jgi:antitoxin HicB